MIEGENYDILFAKEEYKTIIDELCDLITVKYYSKKKSGRPLKLEIINIVKAIIYVLKTGSQWYMIPKEFGNYSSIKKHYLKYVKDGTLNELWYNKLNEYTYKRKGKMNNMLMDCTLIKSVAGHDMIGRNPCDRGRMGTKLSFLTDDKGIPLSVAVNGANVSDHKMMSDTFANLKIKKKTKTNLYCDKGYSNKNAKRIANENNYNLVCENKKNAKNKLFRKRKHSVNHIRYAIEAGIGWVKKFKRLTLRYNNKIVSYMGFIMIAFSIIIQRVKKS